MGRLSVGALGLALTLLVSAAWGSGLMYLLARLGGGSPVSLAQVDGVHAYVGLVGGAFVVAKVVRVGLRSRVPGVPRVLLWQRWISWSLLVLYAAILLSGILILTPIRGGLLAGLTEVHFLASVWALLPTTWHVWHYRSRLLPYVTRVGRAGLRRRFWIGLALVVPAALAFLVQPRAASQLTEVMGGQRWSRPAFAGTSLVAVTTVAGGRTLVAGGGGSLYESDDGSTWGVMRLPGRAVLSLAARDAELVVGTTDGLFAGPPAGPLIEIGLPGRGIRAVAVDPYDPRLLAVASSAGPALSVDGGRTWDGGSEGLRQPRQAAAVAFFDHGLFLSDATGVFELAPGARAWRRVSDRRSVTALTVSAGGDRLYATSNEAIDALSGGRWAALAPPGPTTRNNGGMHVSVARVGGVLALGPRLYVPGTVDGLSASADGGQSWTQLGGGIGDASPAAVVEFRGALWSATPTGLLRYQLTPAPPISGAWWALLLVAALGSGVLAAVIAGPDRLTLRIPRLPAGLPIPPLRSPSVTAAAILVVAALAVPVSLQALQKPTSPPPAAPLPRVAAAAPTPASPSNAPAPAPVEAPVAVSTPAPQLPDRQRAVAAVRPPAPVRPPVAPPPAVSAPPPVVAAPPPPPAVPPPPATPPPAPAPTPVAAQTPCSGGLLGILCVCVGRTCLGV